MPGEAAKTSWSRRTSWPGTTGWTTTRGWSAGGAKFAYTDGLVVRANTVVENDGAGLWTDIDCLDTTYEANRVEGNTWAGIFHEISYDAVIRENEVSGNGFGSPGWVWGAGIQVAGSAGVTIVDNLVVGNYHGIVGVEQDRVAGQFGEYRLVDLIVRQNVVIDSGQTGIAQDRGDVAVYDRGHVFAGESIRRRLVMDVARRATYLRGVAGLWARPHDPAEAGN